MIVGVGPDDRRLHSAAGRYVEFRGRVYDAELADLYSRCIALVQPGEEDFGIAPVEAQAAGAPVIALRAGGALDYVTDDTGIFIDRTEPTLLAEAMLKSEQTTWDEAKLRSNAQRFAPERFRLGLEQATQRLLETCASRR